MVDSILDTTKKSLGIGVDDTSFDDEIIMYINSVLSTLTQIGVGPTNGFVIEDKEAIWADLLGDDNRASDVKQYVALRVRLVFDSPTLWHLVNSMQELVKQLEWRINVRREGDSWVDPQPQLMLEPEVVVVPVDQAWYRE